MYVDTGSGGANFAKSEFEAEPSYGFDVPFGASRQINDFVKRIFDVALSSVALLVLLPFLLFVALAVRLDSAGPALFVQSRWGKGGRVITVLKFRSMYIDECDITGVKQTTVGDARITRIGRWLRASNVDELPQLFNVLRGDMSLVGPRCHAIGMRAAGRLYEELVPNYHIRHCVRPGMTGLAQIRGWRGPTQSVLSAKARIACDLHYIANRSVWLDLNIMMTTLRTEFARGSGL